ncbi:MAG: hypothetical protein R3194_00860 [Limnobacter sp.]|nr:hypothetical protein [Limnobacter sp.]
MSGFFEFMQWVLLGAALGGVVLFGLSNRTKNKKSSTLSGR